MAKRGKAALTVCSTSFQGLGRAQQKALGSPDLPIAVIPHPFGTRNRDELREIAGQCVEQIAQLLCESAPRDSGAARRSAQAAPRAALCHAVTSGFVRSPEPGVRVT